jgi:hypothetical protein
LNHDDREIVIDFTFRDTFDFVCWKLIPSVVIASLVWFGMANLAFSVASWIVSLFTDSPSVRN